jgi:uracil-DNA glycosylase family 4
MTRRRSINTRNARPAWEDLNRRIEACTACERLVAHCQTIAREKRAAYRAWDYWGRPVPNFGDERGRLLIVGLAPGAHGSNRTGRMFTGDESGNWLYRAMHRAGFASQPHAADRDDGLRLIDCAITAVGHCAPPDNKPTTDEIANCRAFLVEALDAAHVRVYLALGIVAWREMFRHFKSRDLHAGAVPAFRHEAAVELADGRWAVASYHPSRQNTNTGKLTERMLDDVFVLARRKRDSPAAATKPATAGSPRPGELGRG